MFTAIFLVVFLFKFSDTLPYGKEDNDYGYSSLLSSSLDWGFEGPRYGHVDYNRGGESHKTRNHGQDAYGKHEGLYDKGHRAGFRGTNYHGRAQKGEIGYGDYDNDHEREWISAGKRYGSSKEYLKSSGGYDNKYPSSTSSGKSVYRDGYRKIPWDSYKRNKNPWDSISNSKGKGDFHGDSEMDGRDSHSKKDPWDSYHGTISPWDSYETDKKKTWGSYGSEKNYQWDSPKKKLWDLSGSKRDKWEEFGKSGSTSGKYADYTNSFDIKEKGYIQKQGAGTNTKLSLDNGYMSGVGYDVQDGNNYGPYDYNKWNEYAKVRDIKKDGEKYGEYANNKYSHDYNRKDRQRFHSGRAYSIMSDYIEEPGLYRKNSHRSRESKHNTNQTVYDKNNFYQRDNSKGYGTSYYGGKSLGFRDSSYAGSDTQSGGSMSKGHGYNMYEGLSNVYGGGTYKGNSKGYSGGNHISYGGGQHEDSPNYDGGTHYGESFLGHSGNNYGAASKGYTSGYIGPSYQSYSFNLKPIHNKKRYGGSSYDFGGYKTGRGYGRYQGGLNKRNGYGDSEGYNEPFESTYAERY